MRIDIISSVPALLEGPLNHSIVQRARDNNLVEIHIHDLRDYTENKHKKWMITLRRRCRYGVNTTTHF